LEPKVEPAAEEGRAVFMLLVLEIDDEGEVDALTVP
jgi:hypothetical protein